jgi:predicted phage terminase large subunit-like protein
MVSVFWPVWEWIKRSGETRWIFASFDLGLQKRDGKRALDILQSDWFRVRWADKVELTDTDPSVLHYHTKSGGWRYGTSVRGPVTGRHADRLVVDDPIKPREVTKTNLDNCIEWWDGTMGTRQADPKTTARVIMMQRLHDRDLAGEMIRRGGYEILRLPMRYEERNPCVTVLGTADPRGNEGALLHPERIPEAEVTKLEATLGPVGAAAQLQQRPTPAGGNIFHMSWLEKFYDFTPPNLEQVWQSWDMTFKGKDDSDFVCGTVWGRVGPDFYLLWLVNERLSFVDTLAEVRNVCARFPTAALKLVEDKANGPAVVSTLEREIPGWELINPAGGKVSRANAIAPLFKSGNVWLPRKAPWLAEYRDQLTGFPKAPNDDMVDSTSQGLHWGLENYRNFVSLMEQIRGNLSKK